MRILITGASGFIGSYLISKFQGEELYGSYLRNPPNLDPDHSIRCDIQDRDQVLQMLKISQPNLIFHLAAQSSVVDSWRDPYLTFRVNLMGTLNLLEAVLKLDLDPRIVVACSSAAYGDTASKGCLKETDPLAPISPYGVSKASKDLLCYQYYRNFGIKTIRARIFGTIGPGKRGDAASEFAEQIAKIEAGIMHPVIKVGNLESRRDLMDVRDCVEALKILGSRGDPGEAYNICSGKAHSMRYILEKMLEFSELEIKVEIDPSKLRCSDEPLILGDNSKMRKMGWVPKIPLEMSLREILEYWRRIYSK